MLKYRNIGVVEEWEKRDNGILKLRDYGIIGLRN